ncbi:MAG: Smr/MutS family protein [Xanthobacteraceae bacterium]|nr:Smr/MutS family protein [Xanthobacteraceae bacterium]
MKRSRPPQISPAVSSRRKRMLAREEIELWQTVTRAIKPLRPKAQPDDIPEIIADGEGQTPPVAPSIAVPRIGSVSAPKPAAPPPLAPIGRREKSQLSRGRKDIEARLDLHGMTQARAHRALRNFLVRASEDGLTFVLVITGKGRSGAADAERGVLRRQVPEWLSLAEFRGLVVGFEEASIGHGGAGALYVRVRRVR